MVAIACRCARVTQLAAALSSGHDGSDDSLNLQSRGSASTPSFTPSIASHASSTRAARRSRFACVTRGFVKYDGVGYAALRLRAKDAKMLVKGIAGAPATTPSKS